MVSKEQKKIERVINFMKKGLTSLADDLGETVKGINDFIKSLAKAQKDLKEISIVEEVTTVSTSSKKVLAPASTTAKTKAASTLFSLLSGSGQAGAPVPATAAATPSAPSVAGGPPKRPGKRGPPSAPTVGAPPTAPSGGPSKRANLPPAPKLPPAPTPGATPPKAPTTGGPPAKPPSFAKRPGPPAAPTGARPPTPSGGTTPAMAPKAGGGLSSLRDEMLDELNRLKKIMRGE